MIDVKKISLPVDGMTCASCVARVEKTVAKMESISNVMSDFTGLVQAVAEPNRERIKIFAEKVS